MKKRIRRAPFDTLLTRTLAGIGLVGACTVVDKGDYTFTDHPGDTGGASNGGSAGSGKGGASGGSSGSAGKGGTGGDAGDGSGATGGSGGTAGTSGGDAGAGTGGGDGGACDTNPCLHGGTCVLDVGGTASCDCAPGYEGPTCATNIDECTPTPCKHNAPCQDLVADYKCDCAAMDTGKDCGLPRFQGLGNPGGMGLNFARAVSADGTVVLGEFPAVVGTGSYVHPYAWTVQTGAVPLPMPTSLRPDVVVFPRALSGDGLRWVGGFNSTASGPFTPIGGKATDAQIFAIPTNATSAEILDTDATGAKGVGYFVDGMNNSHAAVWTDAGTPPIELPNNVGGGVGGYTRAGAVSRDGRIVGGVARDTSGNWFAVAWADADVNPTPPSTRRTSPVPSNLVVTGMSADGVTIVGTITDNAFADAAFAATSTVVSITPIINAVPATSHAWDVSDDGNVIVGDAQVMSGMGTDAAVWQGTGRVFQRLVDVMRGAFGPPPPGWVLVAAYGVSADGKVIVGQALHDSVPEGFIVRLP